MNPKDTNERNPLNDPDIEDDELTEGESGEIDIDDEDEEGVENETGSARGDLGVGE